MAEDSNIILNSEDQSLGTIQIAPRVLEIIAGIAAGQIEGVSRMHGSIANSVSELLGRSDHRRGVKLPTVMTNCRLTLTFTWNMAFPFLRLLLRFKIKSSSRLR